MNSERYFKVSITKAFRVPIWPLCCSTRRLIIMYNIILEINKNKKGIESDTLLSHLTQNLKKMTGLIFSGVDTLKTIWL